MPKYSDTPMPPLDEEMLADLAKIPAKLDGERQPWSAYSVHSATS